MSRWMAYVIVATAFFAGAAYGNQEITVDLPGGITMDFVWIEPGTFMMGMAESETYYDEGLGPRHEVTISQGYWLGKYETTQAQWQAVMGTTPWLGQDNVMSDPNNPVSYISWNDAQGFIHKLNVAEEDSLYRLPTEAEWEYACRAGTTTLWSFGDDESKSGDYSWYAGNTMDVGEPYPHAVGTKLPNPWGLFDMHGNVFEWVQDWWGDYPSNPQIDPTGPETGNVRVVRGGFYYYQYLPKRG